MKKFLALIIAVLIMFTGCSKWKVEIRKPEEQNADFSSGTEAENKPDTVLSEPLKYDLDILNYLHLVSLYGDGVSFYPGEGDTVYYGKTGEESKLPLTTAENDLYCFDYKDGSTFIIVGKGTKNEPLRLLFSDDNGKSWDVNDIDGIDCEISEMYISIIGENRALWIFNTAEDEGKYIFYDISANGEITERKDSNMIVPDNLLDVSFVSEKTGYAIGESKPEPALFRTEDGGINWEKISVDLPEDKNISFCLPWIPLFYENIGFMRIPAYYTDDAGNQKATTYYYISSDGGLTWELLSENSDEFSYTEQEAWEIMSIFENNNI